MATFNAVDLFVDGASRIVPGAWRYRKKHSAFPGVDGTLEMRMGKSHRVIVQEVAFKSTLATVKARIEAIEAYLDLPAYTLIDDFTRTYENVSMQTATPGPILKHTATTYTCRIVIRYWQLAPNA